VRTLASPPAPVPGSVSGLAQKKAGPIGEPTPLETSHQNSTRVPPRGSHCESASNFDPSPFMVQIFGAVSEFAVFVESNRHPRVTPPFPRNRLRVKDLRWCRWGSLFDADSHSAGFAGIAGVPAPLRLGKILNFPFHEGTCVYRFS
jgi:hypothetical protein